MWPASNASAVRFEAEANGRRSAATVPDFEVHHPGEVLIFSVASRVRFGPQFETWRISPTLEIDAKTIGPGVFAAATGTTGTAVVWRAIAAVTKSAEAIHRYRAKASREAAENPALPVGRRDGVRKIST